VPKHFKFRAGPSLAVTAITARPARDVSLRRHAFFRGARVCARNPGNANLQIGALKYAIRENGVPSSPAGLAPGRTSLDRHYALTVSVAAFLPAMRPWTVHRAKPCKLNPPADSPPQ
jgi:hypothetical protein